MVKTMKAMARRLGIKWHHLTAFHPQTDGQMERVNQELKTYLCIYCSRDPQQWAHYLPLAEFTYNDRLHSTTQKAPFNLLMGYTPKALEPIGLIRDTPKADEHLSLLKEK